MFAFSQAKPYTGSIRSKVNIPMGEYLSVALEQGVHDSMFNSISSMTELDLEREGRIMTANEANKQYGLGTLKFEQDVHESVARVLHERKTAEMRRQYYLSQGNPGGLFSGRGLAGVGAGFLGSILNPLDFSVNFLPVVGSEAAAARLASRGAGPVRQTLARGLVTTEEALARSIPVAPRLTSALIQGAVGNVVAEVPHLISALESQEDYTFADSVVNVAAGTVLGGALHLAVTSAVRVFDRLSAGTKETMLRQAIDQFVKGEDVRVEKYVEIDPNIIRERVRFDEASARLKAIEELPDDLKQGELVGHRIVVTVDPVELGLDRGKIEVLITKNTIPGEAEYRITLVENNNPISHIDVTEKTARYIATKKPDAKFLLTLPAASNNGSLLHPDDLTGDQARRNRPDILEWGEPIFKESAQKETNLKALLESERAAWDEEGRFRKEMRAEIDRQIAEGKTLTPEQAEKWGFAKEPEKTEATLKEQSSQLEKEIKELQDELGELTEADDKGKIDQILEKLESFKIDLKGKTLEGVTGMPVWLWNGAVDAVILAVKAGKTVAKAIDAGVKYLKTTNKDFRLTKKTEESFRRKIEKQIATVRMPKPSEIWLHGTNDEFTKFDIKHMGKNFPSIENTKSAFWFSKSAESAVYFPYRTAEELNFAAVADDWEGWTELDLIRVIAAKINEGRVKVVDLGGKYPEFDVTDVAIQKAKKEGFDAVRFKNAQVEPALNKLYANAPDRFDDWLAVINPRVIEILGDIKKSRKSFENSPTWSEDIDQLHQEIELYKKTIEASTKSNTSAIEQALTCLIINS